MKKITILLTALVLLAGCRMKTGTVLDFGADPTGVKNSADAIDKAFRDYGIAIFPPGKYFVSSEKEAIK